MHMHGRKQHGWALSGARKVKRTCPHCGNETEHFVYVAPRGIQVPLIGKKTYHLACPICGFLAEELTKKQAFAMKR